MGLAYLPDGSRMDYEQYLKTAGWRRVKANRLAFDNWRCAICHTDLMGKRYETHHLLYNRLGHENIETDVISLCPTCHQEFHNAWSKVKYWEESPLNHWKTYSLEDTAKLCFENLSNDTLLGGDYNLCSDDVICGFIDQYYREHEVDHALFIYENDIKLFFRNKRYELMFDATANGEDLDHMLDRLYGTKGQRGSPNPLRTKAKQFFTKHKPAAMKRIYKENANVTILMNKVEELSKEAKDE